MTPRSRKPVIIGGMRGLTTDTYHPNFIDFQMDDEVGHSFEYCQNTPDQHRTSLQRSKSENSLLCRSPIELTQQTQQHTTELIPPSSATLIKSTSDETLSTPFRYFFYSTFSFSLSSALPPFYFSFFSVFFLLLFFISLLSATFSFHLLFFCYHFAMLYVYYLE